MIRLAQIGMGGWGRNWAAHVVKGVPGVRLTAVIDAKPEVLAATREQLGNPHGVAFVPSLKQAVEETDFDALLITCGPGTHVPLAVEALKAGKHVLTEKPFGLSTREAHRAILAAQRADRLLMVSQNYRFYPAPRTVHRLLESGKYGPVGSACLEFRREVSRNASGKPVARGAYPFVLDMVIHHVDLIRFLFGTDPTSVHCRAWNPPWSENAHPLAISATFVLSDRLTVAYEGSWVTTGVRTPWSGKWRIECRDAQIEFTSRGNGLLDDRVTVVRPRRNSMNVRMRKLKHADRPGALAEFVRAIRDGRQPECAGQDNIKSLAVIESLLRSIKSGRTEPVKIAPG
jgi:predicted dehydrogenase